jgi:hypothetical protein
LIWRSNLAQNDPKDPFGATIWQRFGEAIKHLCISIFEIMIWEEWKAKFRKFSENFGYFRKPHIFLQQFSWLRFWRSFTWIRKIFSAEKMRDSPWLIFHFATKYFNNMVFLFIYMQKKRCFSNITTYLILAYKTKLINII